MFKKLLSKFREKLRFNEIRFLITVSIFLVIFYNYQTIKSQFLAIYQNSGDLFVNHLWMLSCEVFVTIAILILFLLLISFISKFLLKFLLITFFLISSICLYILNHFGIILDESLIANALTSVGEVSEVVDYSLLFYLLFFAAIPIFAVIHVNLIRVSFKKKSLFFLAALLILLFIHSIFLPTKIINIASANYSPINYIKSFYNYYNRIHKQLKQKKDRVSLSKLYHFNYDKKLDNFNVILVIGESLRSDHLGLNYYQRNTTPNLSNLSKTRNFLNYSVSASFNVTTKSVTSMLSSRTKKDFVDLPPEKGVISVFRELGFKTYWYSNQSSKEFINGMLTIMASEADEYFFRDRLRSGLDTDRTYDEALLPFLKKAINSGGNNFIILHSFGSHIRFYQRYPENFAIFKPECFADASSCKNDEVINSYDNSVLYTDHFLSELIKILDKTNSILFFAADHGVFLGEKGVYANGNSDQIDSPVHRVPMFFYETDKILQNNFYRKKFLKAAKKTNLSNLSHDNLFNSLLDCSGIESNLLERNLSICR